MNKSFTNALLGHHVSDRAWVTRWTVLAAGLATITGATIAFGQNKNDGFDRPLNNNDQAEQEVEGQGSSTSSMTISENGKQYSVEARDGKVTRVEVDGERIPKDRWRYDGKKLEILDKDGEVEKSIDFVFGDIPGLTNLRFGSSARVIPGNRAEAGKLRERIRAERRLQDAQRNQFNRALAQVEVEHPKVMLGITFSEVGEDKDGVIVDSVVKGLPADEAGIKQGDVITKMGDKNVVSGKAFRELLSTYEPDDKVDMQVQRDGQKRTVTVVLEEYDAEKLGASTLPGVIWRMGPEGQNIEGQELAMPELQHLFRMGSPFGAADQEKMQEQLNAAREQLQKAMEQLKANKADFEQAREEASKSLSKALDSLEELKSKLSEQGNNPKVWTTTPRGDVLVPQAPGVPGANTDDMKKLMEKLERLESKVEELQRKKD